MSPSSREPARHLVVVGSSAGGIEALSRLVGDLKPDFPAAVVLAQHLDPARPSYLRTILERKTPLPVVLVEKQTTLEKGTVYLVPANQHVVIEDGKVNMEGEHGERHRPSVDLLLSSAARSFGEQLVAVILTGSGSDGAAGAVDVKAAGGVVVIQNPATAAHPSMPLALPPTVVDHVADIESMGALLQHLVTPPAAGTGPEGTDALPQILDLVSRHASIDFQSYKPATITRRIHRRMAALGLSNVQEYQEYLGAHRDEIGELARSFLIKVTEFFRDPEAFEFLRRDVLPGVLEAARARGRVLRVWSAGCATGEEAYSLALLVREMLGDAIEEWSVRVFATDLDDAAVNFARRGVYPANVLRFVPDEQKDRYFDRLGGGFRVSKPLRQSVIFGQQDLARGAPFPRIDLVVCRNLLIYLKPELQQDLLDLFAYALHQTGGYLFLGKAETARPARGSFDLVNKRWKIYRCVSGPMAMPVGSRPAAPVERARPVPVEAVARDGGGPGPETSLDIVHLRRLNELVLRHLPTGVVLLDRNYRILSLNATARRLLGVHEPVAEQDFLHAVRALPYAAVRDAVDRALRDKTPHTVPELAMDGPGAEPRFVTLQVAPVHTAEMDSVVLSVTDATEIVNLKRQYQTAHAEQRRLVEDLDKVNTRLKQSNDELQEANEELQGANEELLLAQEELQATNEEFEATNEELQATNEELETNNEELQATNEELEATNEELTARTGELQEITNLLSAERLRLTDLLEAALFSVMVLRGDRLVVEAVNARADGFLPGREAVGRPLDEIFKTPTLQGVAQGAHQAFDEDRRWTSAPVDCDGTAGADARAMIYTAVPTHDRDGKKAGIVLYGHALA
jgi:two-component system CheB/CheR fusion protein